MLKFIPLYVTLLLPATALALSDDEIKDQIIRDSISSYPGRCPCPYNVDRAGRDCGERSAWSKPGGRSPICYREDISKDMVEKYRKTK